MDIKKSIIEKISWIIASIAILFFFIVRNKLSNFIDWIFWISLAVLTILFTLLAILVIEDFAKDTKRKILQKTRELKKKINLSIDKERRLQWTKKDLDEKQGLCINRVTYYEKFINTRDEHIKGMKLAFLFITLSIVVYSLLYFNIFVLNNNTSEPLTFIFTILIFYPINYIIKFIITVFEYLKTI